MIVVDGNDGTGKSTLVAELRRRGLEATDRGLPTKMTDNPDVRPAAGDTNYYVILDLPIEISQERLVLAGKDLTEKYHTAQDLGYYRGRFKEVFHIIQDELGPTRVLFLHAAEPVSILADRVESLVRDPV
jgi:thymidylate kinase